MSTPLLGVGTLHTPPAGEGTSSPLHTHLFLTPLGLTPLPPISSIVLYRFTFLDQLPELLLSQKLTPSFFAALASFAFLCHA